ncbi:Crp/Fnr family transcriptional regulator [Mangrovicella endophytica]|uniref:Crp/Fnr family transcriptional regulator n=1 Tax=Mangrovicella endophytica TaxID=2066697 RepID=UPI0013000844|nr:Crp/Fnr family transcriptional regulator [Mangrovicella endophytica]
MQDAHIGLTLFLGRLKLNSTLSEAEQAAILNLSFREVQVATKDDLIMPGETVTYSTLVAHGHLGRFDLMRNGSKQITAFYIPGDMCDLFSVVAPTVGWGISAFGPATVLQVPHAALMAVATEYPNLAFAFWRDTTLDASILAKWASNIGRKKATPRIAHLLCEIGIRLERAGLGSRQGFELELTQEQIGDAVGLTSVHVNRSMQALRADGLIVTKRQMMSIPDWNRLAEAAEFAPAYLLHDEATSGREEAGRSA